MNESVPEMPARRKYVITGDLRGLMRRWAEPKGFVLPGRRFFSQMEEALVTELRRIFEPRGVEVQFIPFNSIQRELSGLIEESIKTVELPIISLDRVYVPADLVDDFFDTTRIAKYSKHAPTWEQQWEQDEKAKDENRGGERTDEEKTEETEEEDLHGPRYGAGSIAAQVERIIKLQPVKDKKRIVVVDDGIWSGASLCGVEQVFAKRGVTVARFIVAIWTKEKSGKKSSQRRPNAPVFAVSAWDFSQGEILDWICARDFCLGAPMSGKTIGEKINGSEGHDPTILKNYSGIPMEGNYGAPYMLPLGHVKKWATIPEEELKRFSRFCLKQAKDLYRRIEEQTKASTGTQKTVRVGDLDRPPFFYRKKKENPVVCEIDLSLKILNEREF